MKTQRREWHMIIETDWRDASIYQEMLKIASNHQEVGDSHGTDSPSELQKGKF